MSVGFVQLPHFFEGRFDCAHWVKVYHFGRVWQTLSFADTAPPGTARRFYRVVKE